MTTPSKAKKKLTHTQVLLRSLGMLVALCFTIYLGLEVIYPRLLALVTGISPSSSMQYARCQANLKIVTSALDNYATKNEGRLPRNQNQLLPDYLPALPICPAARRMTYRTEFRAGGQGQREQYRVICAGGYHKVQGCNGRFPAFDSVDGMMKSEQGEDTQ